MGRWPTQRDEKTGLVGRAPRPAADALVGLAWKPDPEVRRGRGRPPHKPRCGLNGFAVYFRRSGLS